MVGECLRIFERRNTKRPEEMEGRESGYSESEHILALAEQLPICSLGWKKFLKSQTYSTYKPSV